MTSIEVGPDDRVSVAVGGDGWFRMWPAVGGVKLEIGLQLTRYRLAPDPGPELTLRGNIDIRQMPGSGQLRWCDLNVLAPVNPHAVATSHTVEAIITGEQLRLAERLRQKDQGVQLGLNLSLSRPADDGRTLFGMGTLFAVIRPGDWIRELERVDAAAYVELLLPITENPERAKAADRIREARQLLRQGHIQQAIMTARAALDPIKDSPGHKALIASGRAQPAKKRTLDERWAVTLEDYYSLASGTTHDDEVTVEFVYTVADAEAIIAGIAGVLLRHPVGSP